MHAGFQALSTLFAMATGSLDRHCTVQHPHGHAFTSESGYAINVEP